LELQKAVKILSETHHDGLHFDLRFDNAYQLLIAALLLLRPATNPLMKSPKDFSPIFHLHEL